MVSSYAFAMFSAHLRDAGTLAAPSLKSSDIPAPVLGKRHRDDEDEDKENREEIEPPYKRQCVRPDFDFEAGNPFWVDDDEEDIRRDVVTRQSRTLR